MKKDIGISASKNSEKSINKKEEQDDGITDMSDIDSEAFQKKIEEATKAVNSGNMDPKIIEKMESIEKRTDELMKDDKIALTLMGVSAGMLATLKFTEQRNQKISVMGMSTLIMSTLVKLEDEKIIKFIK